MIRILQTPLSYLSTIAVHKIKEAIEFISRTTQQTNTRQVVERASGHSKCMSQWG